MTGREKILAAFDRAGTPDFGVVSCYEGIFIRDHYAAITRAPWWDEMAAPTLAREVAAASGLEWLEVEPCASREERARLRFEQRGRLGPFRGTHKGFSIELAAVIREVRGRCMVFGNLDAIGVL